MDNKNQNNDMILKITCVLSSMFKRIGPVILWLLVCGIGFDIFRTFTYKPLYATSLQAVLVLEENTYSNLSAAQSYVTTLDYIFNGQVVRDYIISKINEDDVNYSCNIISQNGTNIVTINVIAPTKRESYYSLQYLTEWYINNAADYHLSYEMDILEDASLNDSPVNINVHLINFRNGLAGGFVFVLLYGFILYLRPTIKTSSDIEKNLDSRLFARIPKERKKSGKHKKDAILITSLKTSFAYREAIKKLRNRVESSSEKHNYKTIMITSSLENEGKSSIAVNLALSLAKNDRRVLIIDGDLRKPSIHKIFELETDRYLNNYLEGKNSWVSQVEYLDKYNLFIMCARQDLSNSEQMINNGMERLIKEARNEFDYVIIDTSPAFGINEPLIINEWVDASLLVVRQNEAPVNIINETVGRIIQAKNNLIGCIYNGNVYDLTRNKKIYGYRYGYNRYERR